MYIPTRSIPATQRRLRLALQHRHIQLVREQAEKAQKPRRKPRKGPRKWVGDINRPLWFLREGEVG
jgi:SPX domain protein involved in polyphosphate accumulation